MSHRISRSFPLLFTGVCLLLLAAPTATAQEPVPWPCTGEAFVVQDVEAKLFQVDQSDEPFVFVPACPNLGIEMNNMGFNRSEGLLYAVQLHTSGNDQLIRIDANCDIFPLGSPGGLPPEPRFDAGELSFDGSTMYVTWGFHTNQPLYQVSLADWQATELTPSGDIGRVHDWAVDPATGRLYGCDGTDGELAELDPMTGVRADFTVADLPSDVAYGGAWFNAAGQFFCYRNSGVIYEIDLGTKAIVRSQTGPASTRNDATACVQDLIGVAKDMVVVDPNGWPATLEITFTFENLGSTESLFALRAEDDLTGVFGDYGIDWRFVSIWSEPAAFANPGYDGHTDTQLINPNLPQSLAPETFAIVTVTVEILSLDQLNPDGEFCNQIWGFGDTAAALPFGDLSTQGLEPDPNNDGSPDEQVPACVPFVRVPAIDLIKSGVLDVGADGVATPGDPIDYTFTVTNTGNVTLTNVLVSDPDVSPITCPSGNPMPSLAPGASEVCTGSYPITQTDIDAGYKDNTATVVAEDPNGNPVTDDDTAQVPIPIPIECGECLGKMTTLTLQYLGTVPDAWIEVVGFKNTPAFAGTVQPDGVFVVDADVFNGTLGPELDLYVEGVFNTIIHTSCSQPIFAGQIWGDFLILAGASKEGGPLCPA